MPYIPTNVRLIREFRVAELKKSTRHLYTPPSVSCTFLILSRAFLLLLSSMAKNRRSPKSLAIAECAPNFTFRSRESMLEVVEMVFCSEIFVLCHFHSTILCHWIYFKVLWWRERDNSNSGSGSSSSNNWYKIRRWLISHVFNMIIVMWIKLDVKMRRVGKNRKHVGHINKMPIVETIASYWYPIYVWNVECGYN